MNTPLNTRPYIDKNQCRLVNTISTHNEQGAHSQFSLIPVKDLNMDTPPLTSLEMLFSTGMVCKNSKLNHCLQQILQKSYEFRPFYGFEILLIIDDYIRFYNLTAHFSNPELVVSDTNLEFLTGRGHFLLCELPTLIWKNMLLVKKDIVPPRGAPFSKLEKFARYDQTELARESGKGLIYLMGKDLFWTLKNGGAIDDDKKDGFFFFPGALFATIKHLRNTNYWSGKGPTYRKIFNIKGHPLEAIFSTPIFMEPQLKFLVRKHMLPMDPIQYPEVYSFFEEKNKTAVHCVGGNLE